MNPAVAAHYSDFPGLSKASFGPYRRQKTAGRIRRHSGARAGACHRAALCADPLARTRNPEAARGAGFRVCA